MQKESNELLHIFICTAKIKCRLQCAADFFPFDRSQQHTLRSIAKRFPANCTFGICVGRKLSWEPNRIELNQAARCLSACKYIPALRWQLSCTHYFHFHFEVFHFEHKQMIKHYDGIISAKYVKRHSTESTPIEKQSTPLFQRRIIKTTTTTAELITHCDFCFSSFVFENYINSVDSAFISIKSFCFINWVIGGCSLSTVWCHLAKCGRTHTQFITHHDVTEWPARHSRSIAN